MIIATTTDKLDEGKNRAKARSGALPFANPPSRSINIHTANALKEAIVLGGMSYFNGGTLSGALWLRGWMEGKVVSIQTIEIDLS
jgi:hypothetical protein